MSLEVNHVRDQRKKSIQPPRDVELSAHEQETTRPNPIVERATRTKLTDFSQGPWRVVECVETGFVYLENPPSYDLLAQDYAWEKTYSLQKERRETREPIRARLSAMVKYCRAKLKRGDKVVHETLRILSEGERTSDRHIVVDIGCGEGRHVALVAQKAMYQFGIDVEPIGLEISDYLAGAAQQRLQPYAGRVIHQPAIEGLRTLENGTVSVIILLSFLEHEVQPAPLLRLCAQKLTKNGVIIIKVPNFNCWNRTQRGRQWCGFRYPDHVSYFTPDTLKMLIKHTGLTVTRMNFMDTLPTNDNMWAIVGRT